jgi:hypothetical protein
MHAISKWLPVLVLLAGAGGVERGASHVRLHRGGYQFK